LIFRLIAPQAVAGYGKALELVEKRTAGLLVIRGGRRWLDERARFVGAWRG
jgi:hypothetical protein